jgi:predicted transcriptional regulator
VDAASIVEERLKVGVKFRSIFPETIVPLPGYRQTAGVERRMLPSVKIRLLMTEKEAFFGFPTLEGKIDYTTFVSKEAKFRKWCLDLFNYYWDQGKHLLGAVPNLT